MFQRYESYRDIDWWIENFKSSSIFLVEKGWRLLQDADTFSKYRILVRHIDALVVKVGTSQPSTRSLLADCTTLYANLELV